MKRLFFGVLLVSFVLGCKKEVEEPQIEEVLRLVVIKNDNSPTTVSNDSGFNKGFVEMEDGKLKCEFEMKKGSIWTVKHPYSTLEIQVFSNIPQLKDYDLMLNKMGKIKTFTGPQRLFIEVL